MRQNHLRERLQNDEVVIGVFQAFESPNLTEMFGYAEFDFIVFDNEHGNMSPYACENSIRAAECGNMVPIIRIPDCTRENVLKSLDRGAMGIIVPMVSTREQAEKVVELSRYYPEGKRGLALSTRAGGYGKRHSVSDHIMIANNENLVVVQIETGESLENLDEILSVDGIDIFFIGPSDLSQSLGMPGQTSAPDLVDKVKKALNRIAASGKTAGIFAANTEDAKMWIGSGARFVAFGAPALLYKGMFDCVEEMKMVTGSYLK